MKVLILFIFIAGTMHPQINGISGGKLSVPDAETLSKGSFEFEPSFSVIRSTENFDKESNDKPLNGTNVSSDLMFRITAGIFKNFEIGTIFSSIIDQISIGTKYNIMDSEKFKAALLSGTILSAGNKFIPDSLSNKSNFNVSIGSSASVKLSENSSTDLCLSYTKNFDNNSANNEIYYGIGIGELFSDNFQGVLEVNGFLTFNDIVQSYKLALLPGITYQISDNLLFVLGSQFDVIGKNANKDIGYFSAFTIGFH